MAGLIRMIRMIKLINLCKVVKLINLVKVVNLVKVTKVIRLIKAVRLIAVVKLIGSIRTPRGAAPRPRQQRRRLGGTPPHEARARAQSPSPFLLSPELNPYHFGSVSPSSFRRESPVSGANPKES